MRGRRKLTQPPTNAVQMLELARQHGRTNAAKMLGVTRQAVSLCLKKWFPGEVIQRQPQPKKLSEKERLESVKKRWQKAGKTQYQKRKAAGLCVKCSSDIKINDGKTVCFKCRNKMKLAWEARYGK